MTRKHFNALAKVCLDNRPDFASTPAYANWCSMVQGIADVAASTNANFDRHRFLDAAGLLDGLPLNAALKYLK